MKVFPGSSLLQSTPGSAGATGGNEAPRADAPVSHSQSQPPAQPQQDVETRPVQASSEGEKARDDRPRGGSVDVVV